MTHNDRMHIAQILHPESLHIWRASPWAFASSPSLVLSRLRFNAALIILSFWFFFFLKIAVLARTVFEQ